MAVEDGEVGTISWRILGQSLIVVQVIVFFDVFGSEKKMSLGNYRTSVDY